MKASQAQKKSYSEVNLLLFSSYIFQTWKKFQSFLGHVLLTIEIFTNVILKKIPSNYNYCENDHLWAINMPNISYLIRNFHNL